MKKFTHLLLSVVLGFAGVTGHAQSFTLSTGFTGNTSTGSGLTAFISFAIRNNTSGSIQLQKVGDWSVNGDLHDLYYSTTSLSGTIDLTSSAWNLVPATRITTLASPAQIQNVLENINLVIPPNTAYRFALLHVSGTNLYTSGVTPNTFSLNGVDLMVGDAQLNSGNVGYAATITPRFFCGSVTVAPFSAGPPPAPIPPLANFDFTLGTDTIWENSPYVLVNTSNGSLRNYWDITGFNANTPSGTWAPVNTINGTRQCWIANPSVCGIDTNIHITNFNYTFPQKGYYRIRLTCVNANGVSYIEKPVFVSEPSLPPKAQFFVDRRLLGIYDQVQFYDLSLHGPTFWQWYTDPPCVNCGSGFPNTFNPSSNTPSPSFGAYDPGLFDVCLVVGNAKGTDTLCRKEYVRVVSGYKLCSGSDSVSRDNEGYLLSNILQAPDGYYYIANQCAAPSPPGFRIAPCADTIKISLERLRLRNNDSVYVRKDGYTGAILRRFGGSNFANLHDTVKNLQFAGQELFITWTPGTPNGPAVSIKDSGFSFRWTSVPALYGPPVADFDLPDTVYTGYRLVMKNNTVGIKPMYAWDLNGDGVFGLDNIGMGVDSVTTNPSITFGSLVPTQRTICLKAFNCVGSDTLCKSFVVMPVENPPTADFTINRTQGFTTDTFALMDKSLHGPNQWRWRFEPNNVTFIPPYDSTSQNPLVFLNAPQSYHVTLVAINSMGQDIVKKFNVASARAYGNPNSVFNPNSVGVDIGITRVVSGNEIDTTTQLKTPTYDPVFQLKRRTVYRGASYEIEVYRPSVVDAQHLKLWIDWNRNAGFNDAGELIHSETASRNLKSTATFTVPFDAPLGNTRLRIGAAADFSTVFTSLSATLGVYEDYGIEVKLDDQKPVVTLNGNAVYRTEVNKPFNDPGATAWDNIEGDISGRIQVIGNIDTTQVGYYQLKYVVADYYGNLSDTVVRQVLVDINQTGPGITLAGDDTIFVEVYNGFVEPGYTALNNLGGVITHLVTISTDLDTATLGTYTVQYTVVDAFGYTASASRTVIVRDTQKPVISSINGKDTVDHQIGTGFDDLMYIKIDDNYWGISSFSRIGTVIVNQQGIYTLRYNTTDGSGNAADEFVLRVFVRDLIPPVIQLKGQSVVTHDVFKPYVDAGVTVSDNYSPSVRVTNDIVTVLNVNVVGQYTITYTAVDGSENVSQVSRIVNVVDRIAPVIQLKGDNPFTMTRGESYGAVDPGYTVTDNYNESNDIQVTIDTSGLISSIGGRSYFVYYRATDVAGNISKTVFRDVYVAFPTGLQQIEQANGLLYPNPSTGRMYWTPIAGMKTIEVYDIQGKRIANIIPENSDGFIDIQQDGMYLIRITTDTGVLQRKIVVQR